MRTYLLTLFLFLNAAMASAGTLPDPAKLWLRSHAAVIMDQHTGEVLYQKNAQEPLPIASITKLMTAMVLIDARLDMDEAISISAADKDKLRYSRSRLPVGSKLTRADLLKMALMASENRAAAALARTYPGGSEAFIRAMNTKSRKLGMQDHLAYSYLDLVALSIASDIVPILGENRVFGAVTFGDAFDVFAGRRTGPEREGGSGKKGDTDHEKSPAGWTCARPCRVVSLPSPPFRRTALGA